MSYELHSATDQCYEGTACLINKLDIRDEKQLQDVEAKITFAKAVLLETTPIKGNFDFEHYKQIHNFLFCDLYDWAGQIRTIDISKKGTRFTQQRNIEPIGKLLFQKIANGYLRIQDKGLFVARIAELYHDINMLHPFREGNGRTQRAFFTQLIRHHGYNIHFSQIDTDLLMFATIQASQGIMDLLYRLFADAIQ